MLNIAYTHVSVVVVIFHYYTLQNKQSNSLSLCSMTSLVRQFSDQIKLNISKSKAVTKFYQRSYTVILTDLSNAIRKLLEKISFHKHFKQTFYG